MTAPDRNMLPDLPPASLRLRIDRGALADNWRALHRLSGKAEAGAAVKADAYGVGIDVAMPALLEAGARQFFVAHWSEVPALLAYVAGPQISVLHGVANASEAAFAKASGVRPVLNSGHQIAVWNEAGGGVCHVMLDTGINRLGCAPGDVAALGKGVSIAVLMSHLASADEDCAQNGSQLRLFKQAASTIAAQQRSLANSAGIAVGAAYHFDLTRPGLSLYGGIARPELASAIKQVVFPEAAILQVRMLSKGDRVGYNGTFIAPGPMRAATVSLGYADGVLRCWGNKGALLSGDVAMPIIGRVSMDMVMIDCSAAPWVKEGDFVQMPYYLPDAASATGLSQYELLTLLADRFAR